MRQPERTSADADYARPGGIVRAAAWIASRDRTRRHSRGIRRIAGRARVAESHTIGDLQQSDAELPLHRRAAVGRHHSWSARWVGPLGATLRAVPLRLRE